ncbi:DUF4230 domain-containing protein [Actinosynnema sp. NPDC023587]|uniref:DUF4230 domain-containing protein n=1 Tax=Actinosynnema sp. NPDC023587 TaxID=3154695 RepID=UPI0033FB5FB2
MKWRMVVAVAGVVAVAALVAALLVVPRFGTDTIDRSQPAVLQSLRDLSQFHAAVGEYQVVLDIERDVQFVPGVLAGQRTLFVAAGSVNAYVEFGQLADGALTVSQDGGSVEVDLPKPVLDKPNLHQDRCYVFAQERGLVDRLAAIVEAPDQQPFYVAAEQKLSDAARDSGLATRAEESTRRMLTGMLGGLGYQVRFADAD